MINRLLTPQRLLKSLKTYRVYAVVFLLVLIYAYVLHFQTRNATPVSPKVAAILQNVKLPPKASKAVKISTVKQNSYQVKLASVSNIDQPVQFQTQNTSLSFTPLENKILGPLNKHTVVQKDGVTTYENIYNGVNLVYTPTKDKLLEEYEVRSKHEITELIQKIDLTNVDYKTIKDGSLEFYSKDTGAFVYAVPKPVMYEKFNTRDRNYSLHYEIIKQDNVTYLAKVMDDGGKKWLSEASYPVMIDATVVTNHLTTEDYGVSLGNWQIRLDTVGAADLHASISPPTATFQSLSCNGQNVQVTNTDGTISAPDFSCSGDAFLTYHLAQPSNYSMNISYGSDAQTLTTTYSSSAKPVFESAYVDPTLVHPGDIMHVYAHITDESGVATVSANMGGVDTVPLSKVSGTANDGQWQATWRVHDTLAQEYVTTISATNVQNQSTTSHEITWFDPYSCLGGGDHAGADWTPVTDCPGGIAGNHTNIGTMTIATGTTATVQAYDGSQYGSVQISATTVTLSGTGTLTAAAKGYRGGTASGAGEGPGGGGAGNQGGGGGHGGAGGTGNGGSAGVANDSYTNPVIMGSGGGANGATAGGAGGGAIKITATGTLTVSGTISANSQGTLGGNPGQGAGGSINLTAATFAGSGTLTATGAAGGNGLSGGAGGRIAVNYSSSNTFNGTYSATAGTNGTNGTVIVLDTVNNDLYINTSQTWDANSSLEGSAHTYRNVSVSGSSTWTWKGYYTNNNDGVGIVINATNFTINTGSSINADAKGYAGGTASGAGGGPGGGGAGNQGGGGGHGGAGGTGNGGSAGVANDSLTNPVLLGSGGGANGATAGGAGGGAVKITATGTLTVSGTISANSQSTVAGNPGQGSGGSINLTAGTITGSSSVSATGAAGGNGLSGGAGGRIAIKYSSSNTYSGTMTATGGSNATNGTVIVQDTTNNDLTINNTQTWDSNPSLEGSLFNYRNVTVGNNATLTIKGYSTSESNGVGPTFNVTNFTVSSGATISLDGQGYTGGNASHPNGHGPGGGLTDGTCPVGNTGGGGGGYGGTGGQGSSGSLTAGGPTYGSASLPLDLGSGGGGGTGCTTTGGSGGGAIRVSATSTISVGGTISANGNIAGQRAGGGSGGSIFLTGATLTGNGTIRANGGAINGAEGAGGGGGRIALYYTSANSLGGTITASAGSGGTVLPSAGTVTTSLVHVPVVSSLAQYQSDCTSSISVGGALEGTPGNFTGCFKTTIADGDSSDSLYFEFESQSVGTAFTNIAGTSSTPQAYTGTPLTQSLTSTGYIVGTNYHWQVRGVDQYGAKSAWSSFGGNTESDSDFIANLPSPTSVTVAYVSDSQLTISWSNTATTNDSQVIERSVDGGGFSTLQTLNATDRSYPDTSTSANHTYTYRVKNMLGALSSGYGTSAASYTTPSAPSSAATSQTKMGTVVVTWTDNSAYEGYFEVQRKIGAGSYVALSTTIAANATSYTDTTVQENATYSYRVRAIRSTPDSLQSAFSTASDLPISVGAGKGIYLSGNGRLIVQNNVNNQIDVWTSVQNDTTTQTSTDLSYTTGLPAGGPNLPAGTTLNNLTVVPAVSEADGKSEVIYAATNNGVVAIHENALTPADGAVKRYTKDYISELMIGDIRGAWPLDDSTGSGLFDASPKLQTLTNNGTATFTSGIRGKAVSLNGSSQYLSITDNANLSVTGSVTFGAWIKTNSISTNQKILAKNGSYSLEITSSGTIKATVIGATTATVTTAGTVDTGWHHVVASYSSTSQTLNIYLDGKADNGSTSGTVPSSLTDSAGAFNIGADAGSTLFTGAIDEAFVTAENFATSHVQMLYLAGYRALQNHISSAITGITGADNYQKLLGNSSGGSTVNNVTAVGIDTNNQFLYIGTNDSSGNTGGVSVVGVFSDSVVDLYDTINNTDKKDDAGTQFSADDAIAISIAGVPNPSFRGGNDVSSYGGTVAIVGTDDTASRLWIENQSYSLNQVLGSSTGSGGNGSSSISVPPSLTNAVGTNGEFLYTPAFTVSEQGTILQNYLGTNTDSTALSFNDGVLTSGTTMALTSTTLTTGKLLNLTANTLTSGTGFNLTSSSNVFTGSLADISLTGTTGVTGNVLNVSSTASGAGNKVLNVAATGTGATNTALYVSASGATTNYAAIFASGNVGIGTTAPTRGLEIYNRNELLNRGNLMFTQETAPTALTATQGTTGSLTGNYIYKVTFITANGETEGGTASNTVTASSNRIELSSIPTGTSGVVTSRKIYRTAANGSSYFLLTTFNDNTTTTYSDNTLDGSLGAAMPVNNNTAGGIFLGGTNRIQIDQNGQIGIGNTAPTAQLDVTGGAKISAGLTVSSGANSYTSATTTGDVNLFTNSALAPAASATGNLMNLTFTNTAVNTSGSATTTGLNIAATNNSVGSGGTQETYGIRIQALAGTSGAGTQNNYGIRIGNQGLASTETSYGIYVDAQSGSTTNYAAIFAGGNVGIGKTNPSVALDVTGAGTFSSTLTASSGFTLSAGALTLTASSGSMTLSTYGTTSITSTTATGNINTLADSSFVVAAAATGNLQNLTFTNASTSTSGTSTVTGLNIAGTNSATGAGGIHETYGIRIQALAGSPTGAGTENNYGLRIGNQGKANTENAYGLYVDAQSGSATVNYAAVFAGGNVGIGTTTPGYPLDVQDATLKVNSKNGYLTNGADYSEYMQNEEHIAAHSLVGFNSATGKVRTYMPGDELVGIVSTGIGFVGNGNKEVENDPSYTLVGLVGQLEYDPAQVEIRNNMAYTHDNIQIGTVLANGKILLKANNTSIANLGIEIDTQGNILSNNTNAEGTLVANKLNTLSAAVADVLNSRVTSISTRIDNLDTKYASVSATLTDSIHKLDDHSTQIASLSASLQQAMSDIDLLKRGQNIATTSAVLGSSITASDSATLNTLMVTGDANINNISVMGTFSAGLLSINGVDNNAVSINSLAVPLKLQSNLSANVDIMNGKVLIDTSGNIKIAEGNLEIQHGKIIGNDQIRGINVPVPVNQNQEVISFSQPRGGTSYAVTVSPSWLTSFAIINKTASGFTVRFSTSAPPNSTLDWLVID